MKVDAPAGIVELLRHPERVERLSLDEWDLVIRQGRRADLLGRVWCMLRERGLGDDRSFAPYRHLLSGFRVADKQAKVVRFEIQQIQQALKSTGVPLVLLKGAAYVAAQLPPAEGRLFSDIDILVPKARLDAVEKAMTSHGWETTHLDEYDQRYYRDWMHELPPMRHSRRKTFIDIHHTILPETSQLQPDPQKLLADMQPVPGYENIFTLSNVDMVLHSATHLFHEGELEHGLRDLVDLDALLRHFSKDASFWDDLVARAVEMDLTRPLYYALHYTVAILQTPVPDAAMKAAINFGKPSAPADDLMDALFGRALLPDHSSCDDAFTPLARWLLYIRSHYLRMPPYLLIPHLLRKAWKKQQESTPLAGADAERQ